MVTIDQSACPQQKGLCRLRKAHTETGHACPWAASSSGAGWAWEGAALPARDGSHPHGCFLMPFSQQVTLGQIQCRMEQHTTLSACDGARSPGGCPAATWREECWTQGHSADDALIQFPNSILRLGCADRRTLQLSKKEFPNLHMQRFAPISLQPVRAV